MAAYRASGGGTRRRGQRWTEVYFERTPYKVNPGETEDGIERQKLICTAIIEKKGRISAWDLAQIIKRDVDVEEHVKYRMWFGDALLYPYIQAGMPPQYAGMFSAWPGIVSFTRSCHPLGLINACDPQGAARDAWDVGMIYQPTWSTGLPTAAGVAAGIAEACKPGATIQSVVDVVREVAGEAVREEIDACLEIALRYDDPYAMRAEMNGRFAELVGRAGDYGEELLAKDLCQDGRRCARDDSRGRELWARYRLRHRHCGGLCRRVQRRLRHSRRVDRSGGRAGKGLAAHRQQPHL